MAGQFGVRQGDYFHPWIASVDPEMSAWSPGQLFLTRAIEAMPGLGLRAYDLGPSHDHYKRPYALTQVMVGEGAATARSAAGWISNAVEDAWSLAGGHGGGVVGKVRRRLDAIATTETTAESETAADCTGSGRTGVDDRGQPGGVGVGGVWRRDCRGRHVGRAARGRRRPGTRWRP